MIDKHDNNQDIDLKDEPRLAMDSFINKDGHTIMNLITPVSRNQTVKKEYTDDNFLTLSGGTMNRKLNMGNHSIQNVKNGTGRTSLIYKSYVDDEFVKKLAKK